MTESRGEIELYNQWFQMADLDKDGVLSGAEAVQFFLRSGLPQNPTLFKIWQYVAGDRSFLTRQEFYTSMKLVSLAQSNGNVLDDQQAMRLVNGLAGPVPFPRMVGLGVPPPTASASSIQQQPSRPAPSPPTNLNNAVFPPLTPDRAAVYQTAFDQLDSDKDGIVQGVDCFATFMRSGLSKSSLKDIWDLVAGEQGQLNRHQFVQCLYLIECIKSGMKLPQSLPSGQFPPVSQDSMSVASMVNRPQNDIYSGATLTIPPLPDKAVYVPGHKPQVAFQSAVPPPLNAQQAANLTSQEMERMQKEREAAVAQEVERRRAEEQRVAAAARREFYTQALADLRVAQGKVSRMLVEAQQRLELEKSEAEAMESQYNAAYESFSAEHAKAAPLLEAMKAAEEEKSALKSKMVALESAIAQLKGADPDWEDRERIEQEELRKMIAALSVEHDSLERMANVMQARRKELENIINDLQSSIEKSRASIKEFQTKMEDLKSHKEVDGKTAAELLSKLAPLYNELYSAARSAMVPLPKEALASIIRPPITAFKFDPLRFGGEAAEWEAFDDEGFTISSALPLDPRLMSLTSPSLKAAEDEAGNKNEPKEESEDQIRGKEGDGVDCVAQEEEKKDDEVQSEGDPSSGHAAMDVSHSQDQDAERHAASEAKEDAITIENDASVDEAQAPAEDASEAAGTSNPFDAKNFASLARDHNDDIQEDPQTSPSQTQDPSSAKELTNNEETKNIAIAESSQNGDAAT